MRVIHTPFKGLKLIQGKTYYDNRGFFREILKNKLIKKEKFIFWSVSKSKKNTLRGMHLQSKKSQTKFVSVLKGKIYDVALDLRKKSKTYGKYFSVELNDSNNLLFWIPPGFAHGFLCLKDKTVFNYKCTN